MVDLRDKTKPVQLNGPLPPTKLQNCNTWGHGVMGHDHFKLEKNLHNLVVIRVIKGNQAQ